MSIINKDIPIVAGMALAAIAIALGIVLIALGKFDKPEKEEISQPGFIKNVRAEETVLEKEFNRRYAGLEVEKEAFIKKCYEKKRLDS